MFEIVFAIAMVCGAPEPLPNDYVSAVMESGVLMDEVYGSYPYDLPTVPSDDGLLSYRIIVDPLYQSYGRCFSHQVRSILTDDRSWPGLREAPAGEVPQVWIILSPPGACGTIEYPERSCASGSSGEGQIGVNYLRWVRGSGYVDVPMSDDRAHVINHEVGHHLGHEHTDCEAAGAAYVMTPTLETGLCELGSWPAPVELSGAETLRMEQFWILR